MIETFCQGQKKDGWKEILLSLWINKKRKVNVTVMKKIDEMNWDRLPPPTLEDEKFDFQLNRYGIQNLERLSRPE